MRPVLKYMLLQELFTRTTAATWGANPEGEEAVFTDSTGRVVKVSFMNLEQDGYSIVDIEFERGGRQSVTGAGAAAEVLSSVVYLISNYLSRNTPDFVLFGAAGESRRSLYAAMVNRLAQPHGYVQVPVSEVPGGFGNSSGVFALKRVAS